MKLYLSVDAKLRIEAAREKHYRLMLEAGYEEETAIISAGLLVAAMLDEYML